MSCPYHRKRSRPHHTGGALLFIAGHAPRRVASDRNQEGVRRRRLRGLHRVAERAAGDLVPGAGPTAPKTPRSPPWKDWLQAASSIRSSAVSQRTEDCSAGYCTPGLIMATVGLLNDNPDPTEEEVKFGLGGNLCRCTGYSKVH